MSGSIWGGGGMTASQVSRILHPGYAAGGFAVMFEGVTIATTAMQAVDLVYLYPFRVYAPITVSSLFQRVEVGGAGSSVKTAVWANNYSTARPTGLPLLGQNAGFDTSSTGLKSAAISNVLLQTGIYWAGTKATGTLPTLANVNSNSATSMVVTAAATLGGVTQPVGFSAPDAYANDILALNLSSATFTTIASARIPVIGLGWV